MTPHEVLAQPLTLVFAFAIAGMLPLLFMGLTAFVKISTVLLIARAALGTDHMPSNAVVLALSAALTILVMSPVGTAIADRVTPVLDSAATTEDARSYGEKLVVAVREPLRAFLKANASVRERDRFYELARSNRSAPTQAELTRDDFAVVIPAFLVTELFEAFMLGFAIFLPFLIVDFVVANVLTALGMQQLSPMQVSLPFKLLLFVAADGWGLLSRALVTGYVIG